MRTLILDQWIPGLDPSAHNPNAPHEEKEFPGGVGSSAVLIDVTIKYPYPPASLPKKIHGKGTQNLERAKTSRTVDYFTTLRV
jgi:hypothetical protein